MEFKIEIGHHEKQITDCIVVGVFEDNQLSSAASKLDLASQGYLKKLVSKGEIDGKLGKTVLIHHVPLIAAERVLLVGCGPEQALSDKEYKDIIGKAFSALSQTPSSKAVLCLTELAVKNREIRWKVRQAINVIEESQYAFDEFKNKKDQPKKTLNELTLTLTSNDELLAGEKGKKEGKAIAKNVSFTKNLGNMPPNLCTPIYLAQEAEKIAIEFPKIKTTILTEKEMNALKMGSLLSVAQGSINPPRFIILEYRNAKAEEKPIVLVGKGITFDTGGNSLKPPMNMIGMKYDMCGGASVLATLRAAAELELPLNLVGLVPCAENMPGNIASRPDDIVTSMSGTTIEILNTDAEGRLILCDALTYAERFEPKAVIDIATLTGACAMALGSHASGVFSNEDSLSNQLLAAGTESGDRCWPFPIWEEYQEALSSRFADVANIGNPSEAGAILGACFLARFTKKYHWAHLDVAGTAFRASGKERGATGRPVPLLVQYLLNQIDNPN